MSGGVHARYPDGMTMAMMPSQKFGMDSPPIASCEFSEVYWTATVASLLEHPTLMVDLYGPDLSD